MTTIAEKAAASGATGPGTLFGGGGIFSTPGIEGETMPYGVFKTGSEEKPFCVYRVNEDGGRFGKSLGCHPSKTAANSQISAIGMATHETGGKMDDELAIGGKPYPNEHACRLRSPDGFQEGSFRRMSREHDGKKYGIIMGRLEDETTMTEQAYRYNRETWTEESARSHCKDHDGSFAAATGKEIDNPPAIIDMRTSTKEDSQEEELQDINRSFRSSFPSPSTVERSYSPWIYSTYDTYVIASVGDEYYRINYSKIGDEITFAPMDQWQPVEKAPEEWVPRSVKAGRRLRSDKLDALRTFKTKFDEMLKDLASFIGWADYEDQKPHLPFRSFKGADGRDWLLVWSTNAFIDKDEEIFTTKSIEDYVARHREDYGGDPSTWSKKGEFQFWHLPGAKIGDILWQGMSGRFLVEAGPFCDDNIATTFKEFFQDHPEGHPEIAPEGWGASHGYLYYPKDREDKVYDWFEKRETSILPASAAANPHNPQMEVFTVDQKQLDALKVIGDDALVTLVVETGEGLTKELEDERIAFKARQAVSAKIKTIAEGLEEGDPQKELLALATQIAGLEGAAVGDDGDETKKAPPGRKQAVTTEEPVADDKDLEEGLRKFAPQLRAILENVKGDAGKELGAVIDAMEAGADRKEGDPPPEKDESEFVTKAELMPALKLISQSILDLRIMMKELAVADKEKIAKIVEDTPKASLENIVAQTLIGREETLVDGRKGFAKDKPTETQTETPGTLGIPLLDNIKQLNQQYIEGLQQ